MGGANSLNGDLRGDSERVTKIPAISPNSTRCCSVQPAPTKPTVRSSGVASILGPIWQVSIFVSTITMSNMKEQKLRGTGPPYCYIACFMANLALYPQSSKQPSLYVPIATITSGIIFEFSLF